MKGGEQRPENGRLFSMHRLFAAIVVALALSCCGALAPRAAHLLGAVVRGYNVPPP